MELKHSNNEQKAYWMWRQARVEKSSSPNQGETQNENAGDQAGTKARRGHMHTQQTDQSNRKHVDFIRKEGQVNEEKVKPIRAGQTSGGKRVWGADTSEK